MHRFFILLILFSAGLKVLAADADIPLSLPYEEKNASARKLQHWYKHHCWKAIERFYLSNKDSMEQDEYTACIPIIALSYCAQGDFDASTLAAKNFFNSPQHFTNATPSQVSAMHAVALKCAVQMKDWKSANAHYSYLLKDKTLAALPLWAKYAVADTALQYNDNEKALALLIPAYANTQKDNPYQPRIAFLLAVANMRIGNLEEAHKLFLEANIHPEAGHLAGIAAKGRVQSTQEILKHLTGDNKKAEQWKLLFDLQALLDDHTSISDEEKNSALKLQAQLLAQLLKYNQESARLSTILDMSASKSERAVAQLQIAFNAYLTQKDFKTFHKYAQDAITTNADLASLKSLRLALFQVYDPFSKKNPAFNEVAANEFLAAYPFIDDPLTEAHKVSAQRLADAIYDSILEPPTHQFLLINLPPAEGVKASLAANLYALVGDYEKSIYLYASIHDIESLENIAHAVKDPLQKEKLNAILAYLNTQNGNFAEGCTYAALAMGSTDHFNATLAALAYASSAWRQLAAQKNPTPDEFLPMLDLLDQLQTKKQLESEPWHMEAALEYALLSAYLLKNDPKSDLQSTLILERNYAKAFDRNDLTNRSYWEELNKNKRMKTLMEHYAALFNAISAKYHQQYAAKNGLADEALKWQRLSAQYSKTALGNNHYITPFIANESIPKDR
ncbi:MAG: hypothetical protein WC222_06405 [Parachlamydiales bacterium]|jgi:hypothetical protein